MAGAKPIFFSNIIKNIGLAFPGLLHLQFVKHFSYFSTVLFKKSILNFIIFIFLTGIKNSIFLLVLININYNIIYIMLLKCNLSEADTRVRKEEKENGEMQKYVSKRFSQNGYRFAAILLTFALIAGCFWGFKSSLATHGDVVGTPTTDESSIKSWESVLGNSVPDTSSAGRILTDKTVTFGDVSLYEEGNDTNPILTVQRSNPYNFMVTLSAISSSKSIVGQDTIPIDVMLILDVSASMQNSRSIPALVRATNSAIKQLLELNINNRVGVVLFSGNSNFGDSATSTATILLPLGRYKPGNNDIFITNNSNGGNVGNGNDTVRIATGVKTEEGQNVSNRSKTVVGGTYIQNGLYQAWQQLDDAENKVLEDGTKKIPIMVLLGDGAPTAASTSYSNIGRSNIGNGGSTGNIYVFTNQLTAAWTKNQLETAYGRTPLLYTLGLGLESLNEDQIDEARMTLNPSEYSNNTINGYWTDFDRLDVNAGGSFGNQRITKADNTISSADRYYVDRFFSASSSSELESAFQSIIEEIYIQSQYYPTDVEGNNASLGGYLVFEDTIGEHMEVKNVNGLVPHDVLYTGKEFAMAIESVANEDAAPQPDEIEYFDEFIRSIRERLGIDAETARAFVTAAYNDGQLYYNSDSDFGHSIKWYGDAEGNYLGVYTEGSTAPEDAVYVNESFFYSGEYETEVGEGVVLTTDFMYISVRISTDIASGQQKVIYSIPAALIPQVRYKITIEGNSLEDVDEVVSVVREEAYPMRLFYEVGLAVTEDNVEYIVGKDYEYYNAENDTYTFYTNAWHKDNGTAVADTIVSFDPSLENEFSYYHKNTFIYTEERTLYEGDTKPASGYYVKEVFNVNGDLKINREYIEITQEALEKAVQDENGHWYIPKGIPKYQDTIVTSNKNENKTGTAEYILRTVMQPNMDNPGNFHVQANLGNNGTITIKQTRGNLQVSKEVTGNNGDPEKDFSFKLTLTYPDKTPIVNESYAFTKTDGTAQSTGTIKHGDSFTLKHGESITISDIPVGTLFTVEETNASDYDTDITVNDESVDGDNVKSASGKITPPLEGSSSVQIVKFTNDWDVPYVAFSFTKVDGQNTETVLKGAEFSLFKLTCEDQNHTDDDHIELLDTENITNCWTFVNKVSSGEDGKVDMGNLTEGVYRLVEIKAPDGYMVPKGQWKITVDPDGTTLTDRIKIEGIENPPAVEQVRDGDNVVGYNFLNNKPIDPPVTGGRGTIIFMAAGIILMLCGAAGFYLYWKNNDTNKYSRSKN